MPTQNPIVQGQNAPAMFPIQIYWPERDYPIQRRSIPWTLIQEHEEQALKNHGGQTLERLAERHGLDAMEAVAVLEDVAYYERWRDNRSNLEKQLEAIRILGERVEASSVLREPKSSPANGVLASA